MTGDRVAVILTNYNMPERTDALYEYMVKYTNWPLDFIVVDNGSDQVDPSRYTALWLEENIQTTGGWMMGLEYSDYMARKNHEDYFAYWIMGTSMEFTEQSNDPLLPLAKVLENWPEAVMAHAALTSDSTTAYDNMLTRFNAGPGPRRTWRLDMLATLVRADWLNGIGRFDPNLTYAWGVPQETSYLARLQGRGIWICEATKIKKVSQIGYDMDRMGMTEKERSARAGAEKKRVLSRKYGDDWFNKLEKEFVNPLWR